MEEKIKKWDCEDFTQNREVLIDKETLAKRISQLGKQITEDYKGKQLTIICILKGAVYFFTDLSREIKLDTKVEFIRASSYAGESTTGEVEFKLKLDEEVTGKDVLVVEDILDTGLTLSETMKYLGAQNPNMLKLCVLLDKQGRRTEHDVKADYVGFKIPNRFVVGYGLDLDERFRNLESIECIVKSPEEAQEVSKEKENLKLQLK